MSTVQITRIPGGPIEDHPTIQYQVARPMGHFERFTFVNDTGTIDTDGIGYRLYDAVPAVVFDHWNALGAAPPSQAWLDAPSQVLHARKLEAQVVLHGAQAGLLTVDYTTGTPPGWFIMNAEVVIVEVAPGQVMPFGHLEMFDGQQVVVEPIPPAAFTLH